MVQTKENPAQPQLLTFPKGMFCNDSVQVHPDIVLGGRAGLQDFQGDMSAQEDRECLEKPRETVNSFWDNWNVHFLLHPKVQT